MTVSSQQVGLIRTISSAGKIGYLSAGLQHRQKTRGTVPRIQFVFIKAIKPPRGHPAQINGRRAEAPHGNTSAYKAIETFERAIGRIEIRVGEAGHQATAGHFCFSAHLEAAVVEKGALAFFGKEKFVEDGVVHGAHD